MNHPASCIPQPASYARRLVDDQFASRYQSNWLPESPQRGRSPSKGGALIYSRPKNSNTSPKRQRGIIMGNPSLTLRVSER